MARDDLFRRSFEAGTAFLDMTRERAEALVKELVKAGDVKKGKASKVIDEVLDRSRRATDDLVQIVRREIGEQVAAMGLATKNDLDNLEQRLSGAGGDGESGSGGTATAPAPEASGEPAAGEAKVTGARTVGEAKAAKATKATKPPKAARKKAAAPAPDVPAGD